MEKRKLPEVFRRMTDGDRKWMTLLMCVAALYYGWRMFALTPWYDELYTYYYFISRGPFYAATHWPLPNNHIGYSVLSALLGIVIPSSAVALRGISFLCALINLLLLYRLGRRYLSEAFALCVPLIYCGLQINLQLSVQGRGYTLGTTCFLLALDRMLTLCDVSCTVRKRDYLILALASAYGLYTVPSNLYWVLPMCGGAGICLCANAVREKKLNGICGKRLLRMILAMLLAALITLLLYAVVWLAVGSNLISKDATDAMYGAGHISIICRAPLASLRRGLEFMLATPFIQSVPREGYLPRLGVWTQNMFSQWTPAFGKVLMILICLALVFQMFMLIREFRGKSERVIFHLMPVCMFVLVALMFLISTKLPYYRVFSYLGCIVALDLALLLKPLRRIPALLISCLFLVVQIVLCDYTAQISAREHGIAQVFSEIRADTVKEPRVTDVDQMYLLKYLYDINCDQTDAKGASFYLLDETMLTPGASSEEEWKFLCSFDTIDWTYIHAQMQGGTAPEGFVLYLPKEEAQGEHP